MANVLDEEMHGKAFKLNEIAALLGAKLRSSEAGGRVVRKVGSPGAADATTLVFAESDAALTEALGSEAAAVLVSPKLAAARADGAVLDKLMDKLADKPEGPGSKPLLIVAQPRLEFAKVAHWLRAELAPTGVHPLACVAADAVLAEGVSVGPFAVVEAGAIVGVGTRIEAGACIGAGCVLGMHCHIFPRAVLYTGVALGDRVVVHAGAVLGSDGFGYARDAETGAYTQFPQQGRLVVEDDVEIGANATIDRGALEETRLGRGTKIDNLVHVGHNVHIGADVVIAAQTGISGSSTIGEGAVVAGQVGIADHVTIGTGAILGAQCGVPSHKHIDGPGVLFWGTPARPITQYLKELAMLARLTKRKTRVED